MFAKILSSIKKEPKNNDAAPSLRNFPRRSADKCVCIIDGKKIYPVVNWSFSGILISADTRFFEMGSEHEITVKFLIRDQSVDIENKVRVVRKTKNNIALQFVDQSENIMKTLQSVVDDMMTNQFIDSQLV